MPKTVATTAFVLAAGLAFLACGKHTLEEKFFAQPPETRLERLRQYPLEDQYKIFRYGNDRREPPAIGLAKAIAERGASAVPFLVRQLDSKPDDIAVRDLLEIFETMANSKSYAVSQDPALMATLEAKVSEMRDREWQAICRKMLKRIKDLN